MGVKKPAGFELLSVNNNSMINFIPSDAPLVKNILSGLDGTPSSLSSIYFATSFLTIANPVESV